MTDRDVVERLAAILATTVSAHQRSDFKPQFAARLKGWRAVELMLELQPLMSARRSVAIAAAVALYRPPPDRKRRAAELMTALRPLLGASAAITDRRGA